MQKWQQWEAASEADWGIAVEREAIIRLLAGRDQLSTCDVDEAIIRLRISRSVLYKLLRRYRQRPQTSSLLPGKEDETTVLLLRFTGGSVFLPACYMATPRVCILPLMHHALPRQYGSSAICVQ